MHHDRSVPQPSLWFALLKFLTKAVYRPARLMVFGGLLWACGFVLAFIFNAPEIKLASALGYLVVLLIWLLHLSLRMQRQLWQGRDGRWTMAFKSFRQPDSYILPLSMLSGVLAAHHGPWSAMLLCLPIILYPFIREPAITHWHRLRQAYRMHREGRDLLLSHQIPEFLRRRVHQPASADS